MIYYIVPPVIIVLSLSAILFFVFRKKEEIQKEIDRSKEVAVEGSGKVIVSKIHLFSLAFLEKLMLRVKLAFLKSYNQFDHWVHSIRNKKEEKQEQIENIEEAREEAEARLNVRPDVRMVFPGSASADKKIEEKVPVARPMMPEIKRPKEVKKEEEAAPMVSAHVVKPEKKKKEKSRLEEALIDRIALNPRDIEAYERLGDYYLDQKNFEDALECFRQILKLSPGNHKAKQRLKKLEKIVLGW